MKKMLIGVSVIFLLSIMSCKKDSIDSSPTTPRTEVPEEIVGEWQHGYIDLVFWENYKQGQYAGWNATPMREAMVFSRNGDAKYYRYEFAHGMYEELIDCTGTVTFNENGTFTFYPFKGRKRFYDTGHPEKNATRQLTSEQLNDPKIAGTRGYSYSTTPDKALLRITVPGSAPYNWYKLH